MKMTRQQRQHAATELGRVLLAAQRRARRRRALYDLVDVFFVVVAVVVFVSYAVQGRWFWAVVAPPMLLISVFVRVRRLWVYQRRLATGPVKCAGCGGLFANLADAQKERPGWAARTCFGGGVHRVLRPYDGPDAPRMDECTGLTATWCPLHGSCSCDRPKGDIRPQGWKFDDGWHPLSPRFEFDPTCVLHGPDAEHRRTQEHNLTLTEA